jgi:hypothetical protein
MSADFTAEVLRGLEGSPPEGLAAFREAARRTGARAAENLRRDLRLGGTREDAEIAWRLVSKLSGMKFRVKREGDRAVFTHIRCPVLEGGGPSMCANFCLPFVEGLTEVLCPSCGVEILKEADERGPCVKALVVRGGGDA